MSENAIKKHGYKHADYDSAIAKQVDKMHKLGVKDYTKDNAITDLAELGIRLAGTKSGWVDKLSDQQAVVDWQKIVAKIQKFNKDYPELTATTGESLRAGAYIQLKPAKK